MTVATWNGSSGDWFDGGNWNTGTVPAEGDTAVIFGGTASITATDVTTFGTGSEVNGVHVLLQNGSSVDPTALSLEDGKLGGLFDITARGGGQAGPDLENGQGSTQAFDALGSTEVAGQILVTGVNDTLAINVLPDGTSAAGNLTLDTHASINVAGDAAADFDSGLITNQGMVLVNGVADIASGVTVTGTGQLAMQQGGSIVVDGTIESGQTVTMLDGAATLKLADLANFAGHVELTLGGAIIDVDDVLANGGSYHSGTLTLLDGTTAVGSLNVNDPDDGGTADFRVRTVGTGAAQHTEISYEPIHPALIINTLPVPIVADVGTQASISNVLTQAFGSVPSAYSTFNVQWKDVTEIQSENFSFWNVATPIASMYLQGGTVTPSGPPGTNVSLSSLGSITVEAGNAIGPFTPLIVPVGPAASPTSQLEEDRGRHAGELRHAATYR